MSNIKKKAFNSQRSSARGRGIDWQFTFDQWCEWWGDDYAMRGRRHGQLCMARKGDTGPYHPDNVYKAKVEENNREVDRSLTNESRRAKLLGRYVSEETKQKQREASLNRSHNEESRKKISAASKGRIPHNKGKKMGEEFSRKMREAWARRKSTKELI